MSNSLEPQTGTAFKDEPTAEPGVAPDKHIDPHEWFASLNLPGEVMIRPSTSLHADYREATCKNCA